MVCFFQKLPCCVAFVKMNNARIDFHFAATFMENIQQITDAVQKGLQLIVRACVQQVSTGLRRLRIELYSDSFHAVLALSCGRAKCQCCITTVTVVVYWEHLVHQREVSLSLPRPVE